MAAHAVSSEQMVFQLLPPSPCSVLHHQQFYLAYSVHETTEFLISVDISCHTAVLIVPGLL